MFYLIFKKPYVMFYFSPTTCENHRHLFTECRECMSLTFLARSRQLFFLFLFSPFFVFVFEERATVVKIIATGVQVFQSPLKGIYRCGSVEEGTSQAYSVSATSLHAQSACKFSKGDGVPPGFISTRLLDSISRSCLIRTALLSLGHVVTPRLKRIRSVGRLLDWSLGIPIRDSSHASVIYFSLSVDQCLAESS